METNQIVELLEKNDALGFTTFMKDVLLKEQAEQLVAIPTEVANKHKAEETAAGKAAGDATTKTTATDPSKTATPRMADGKLMEETLQFHKDAAAKALSESKTAEALEHLAKVKTLEEAMEVVNKHKAEETAAGEKAGNATSKTTATDPGKDAGTPDKVEGAK